METLSKSYEGYSFSFQWLLLQTWKLNSILQALYNILVYIMMDFSEAFKRRYCQNIALQSRTAVSVLLNYTSSHLRIQLVLVKFWSKNLQNMIEKNISRCPSKVYRTGKNFRLKGMQGTLSIKTKNWTLLRKAKRWRRSKKSKASVTRPAIRGKQDTAGT